MTQYTTSRDGTRIAYERAGSGPALIVVDGALCSRRFGPSEKLLRELETAYTVYRYDRRGRGESDDTQPYHPSREVEDVAAIVSAAGGSASLLGLSSGGALALEAAASGLPIDAVIAYEPPYVQEGREGQGTAHEAFLRRLIDNGDRGGAVTYFMKDMVGAPAFVPIMMKLFFWIWPKLVAVAHTLPYDAAVMTGFRVPRARFATINQRVLVLNGSKTDPRLKVAARVLAQTLAVSQHGELAGQTHNVNPRVLAVAVREFLNGPYAVHHHS
jgi:pimeloyl-ACP methyl ester carboxylesterase